MDKQSPVQPMDLKRQLADQSRMLAKYTGFARSDPSFFVIGAQKAGTSTFYANLIQHPQIMGARGKEIHFFNANFSKGWSWYRGHFPLRFHPKLLVARGDGQRIITGEATPNYLPSPYVAERVASKYPNAKLIVLLRNPVARAYSQFYMELRRGHIEGSVGEELTREMHYLEQFSIDGATYARLFYDWANSWSHRFRIVLNEVPPDPASTERLPFPTIGCLLYGFYYEQLKIWFQHFPREQFLIINSADYFKAPVETIEQVAVPFLGLSPSKLPVYIQSKSEGSQYPKIDPLLREQLSAFYRPYNEKLYNLLGIDYGW